MKEKILEAMPFVYAWIMLIIVTIVFITAFRDTSIQELYEEANHNRSEIEGIVPKLNNHCRDLAKIWDTLGKSGVAFLAQEPTDKFYKSVVICEWAEKFIPKIIQWEKLNTWSSQSWSSVSE